MAIIALAVVNAVIWTILTIRWKDLRKNNISSVSSFGLLCAGLPLWIITLVFLLFQHNFINSQGYFINLSVWIILCILTNVGGLFLIKFKALSELGIYRLALSTIVAIIIEMLFLHNIIDAVTLIGAILLLISGFLLPKNKYNQAEDIKLSTTLLLLLMISIAGAIQFAAYKNALLLQASPLLHAMFAQAILYTVFLSICFNSLRNDYVNGKIRINDFLFFGIMVYIYTIIEAFLFKELPITLLIALAVLNILLFQIYDVKNKDLKHSWRLYLATFLALTAIILIKFQ